MTELTPEAQKVWNAFLDHSEWEVTDSEVLGIAAALREVINQLQQSPGVIMCADVLELCEELEAL
jgi:hypothetical protein